jgi:hypothetical protein
MHIIYVIIRKLINLRFRLRPCQAEQLLNIIGEDIRPIFPRNHALSPKERLLVALRFFATNAEFYTIGDGERMSLKFFSH